MLLNFKQENKNPFFRAGSTGSVVDSRQNRLGLLGNNNSNISILQNQNQNRNNSFTNLNSQHQNNSSNLNFSSNIESKFSSHSAQSLLQPNSHNVIHNNFNSSNNNNNNMHSHVTSFPLSDLKSNTFINMDNLLKNTNVSRLNATQFDSTSFSNASFISTASNVNASNFNCNALCFLIYLT